MGERIGQTFVMGAILFSGLVILAFLPLGPSIDSKGSPDFRQYFSQSFGETPEVFNQELSENRSIGNVKRGMYGYARFLEERSNVKGINFETYMLIILPQGGKAEFINYRDSDLETELAVNGDWTNQTVGSEQSLNRSFSPGITSVKLILPEPGDSYELDTESPRIIYWMRMETPRETWENSYIG